LIRISVEQIFNEQLFGQLGAPSNWKSPLRNGRTMAQEKLCDKRARRVVEQINALVYSCHGNVEMKNNWKSIFKFRQVTRMLQQKSDFAYAEILSFQCLADSYFSDWLKLDGPDGVTNFVHMIGTS